MFSAYGNMKEKLIHSFWEPILNRLHFKKLFINNLTYLCLLFTMEADSWINEHFLWSQRRCQAGLSPWWEGRWCRCRSLQPSLNTRLWNGMTLGLSLLLTLTTNLYPPTLWIFKRYTSYSDKLLHFNTLLITLFYLYFVLDLKTFLEKSFLLTASFLFVLWILGPADVRWCYDSTSPSDGGGSWWPCIQWSSHLWPCLESHPEGCSQLCWEFRPTTGNCYLPLFLYIESETDCNRSPLPSLLL